MVDRYKKAVLIIIDGYGISHKTKFNAIYTCEPLFITKLSKLYPSFLLKAHGESVGLFGNQMGNSEVGHLTIGSGRIVPQDLVTISEYISNKSFVDKFLCAFYDGMRGLNSFYQICTDKKITKCLDFSDKEKKSNKCDMNDIRNFGKYCNNSPANNTHSNNEENNNASTNNNDEYNNITINNDNNNHFNNVNKRIHIIGLLSDGGVHSHINHIKAIISALPYKNIYVHCILDGRDTKPKNGIKYIKFISKYMYKKCKGKLGSISGRFYTMDRDNNMSRTLESFHVMTEGNDFLGLVNSGNLNQKDYQNFGEFNLYKQNKTEKSQDDSIKNINTKRNNFKDSSKANKHNERSEIITKNMIKSKNENDNAKNENKTKRKKYKTGKNFKKAIKYIKKSYKEGITDEFIKPSLINAQAKINKNEPIIFANFRADRMRQIVKKFRETNICFTLTEYDKWINVVPIFKKKKATNTLAEIISKNGLKQTHIAETEKYAHVTYFLNGGCETVFENEKRILIESNKVKTHDLKPQMKTKEICCSVIGEINKGTDFVVCNIAAPDMVGHCGNFDAVCEAVRTTDNAVKEIYESCVKNDYVLFITADHGNAEEMVDDDGNESRKHTSNCVPFIICDGVNKLGTYFVSENGIFSLKDVAPTVLCKMGLDVPNEMTGTDLLRFYDKLDVTK
ncbi:2,3-bisphosphoglycerate-independent phosphoglycerate mutase [Edhazardia aedis USNM 41457]|uniref:phosphoglycerate mutase (2,3-diphosphoglycerate-independent) n=1 Tax=Edhazardia aedis (strain USNM 41457) TaxID=1003232 RepID=J9D453_EDHAE|nr:2,3-bisphosphoglycerate-independent phosphoglycerate mutase [Edhazardia aedis USNM 41457]|eukprot:EJW02556.1 2,3-bisphosphoglycerate-independent phosphoglycerate mutase [Edhazardia aedis USNM 41457]